MTTEYVNEPVAVRVDFQGTKVLPRAMHWNNHLYAITSINMVHSTREGTNKRYFFSVSDDTNYFKLQLSTENLEWRLMEMYAG